MSENVKRRYDAPRRAERAAATRRAVLAAARALFTERGYAKTSVSDIAELAGTSVDTVYGSVGRKPVLLRELVESALSGTDHAVPAAERDYVVQVRAARTGREKIDLYAAAVTGIHTRLAPVFLALRDAAAADPACAALWRTIAERRARNMLDFAADLRATGHLRPDLTDDEVADIVWSMNAVEYWVLLVHERGWSPDRFRGWIADAWARSLLVS
ncbi:TetR/AcrR family transcriptional regulator [Actinokineospora sp. NBRC 105648]|uniref:TetR/AcrR family transcriptional regulator n=1 Tax=Actinokineospora sp. NBRC 105648 TaxID=3032206 RepID=UPI0024A3E6D7|nr:TetR/AcrR family transcriptional regulator [Actinokineospora sp. NBRC 105648]GLZ39536.1 TetR family transcriptional regulator [Actinokineospora sp. NBRC 105648]